MHCEVAGVRVHYVEHGRGRPFVALHGAGVDHREIAGALEPALAAAGGLRRIYPDLPGMGRTAAPPGLTCGDDVVEVLLGFLDRVVGDEPFVVGGHSLGAYVARAVAARRRDRVDGLLLLCPAGGRTRDVPAHTVVHRAGDPSAVLAADALADFADYLVVQTPATARRYRDRVVPGAALADVAAVERVYGGPALSDVPDPDDPQRYPTLVVAGRQDSAVGWAGAVDLLEVYPRATLAVVDGAGHALPHERPELLDALVRDWCARL